jgi:hypothetical protein
MRVERGQATFDLAANPNPRNQHMLSIANRARGARRSSAVFAALTALITLAACDAASPTNSLAPLGPRANTVQSSSAATGAQRVVYEALHDLQGSEIWVECGDGTVSEAITLTGKLFERFTGVLDPAGGEHTVYHTMPVGLAGVGSVSGEEFRVKWQDHGVSSETLMVSGGSYRQTLRLVGRVSGRSFALVVSGRYTINANGEVVVYRERLVAECGG